MGESLARWPEEGAPASQPKVDWKWPQRALWLAHYFEQDCAGTAVTALAREAGGRRQTLRMLQCFDFRAEESPWRRMMKTFATDKRISNSRNEVDVWLPIQGGRSLRSGSAPTLGA